MQPNDSLLSGQENNPFIEGNEPVEKTLSIWELITSGGIGGQLIMITLGLLLFFALYLFIFIIDKRKRVKKAAEFGVPSPGNLGELFQSYVVLFILIGFILYFIFR